jgi:hypothetical protein
VGSQIRHHGRDPAQWLIEVHPRASDGLLHTEDILSAIEANAGRLALVLLGGVNYLTGQVLDMAALSAHMHARNLAARADGVVAWQNCCEERGPMSDNIEVHGSHCGLGVNASVLYAIADRLAEACAEWLHARVRREWGFGRAENLTPEQLIEEQYRGIRPAPGYPACPDHTEKQAIFDWLGAEQGAGMRLTESFAMMPAASVSGLYFAHPESRYFAVDRITREQVEAYAKRKGMAVSEVERWLAPNLGYDV